MNIKNQKEFFQNIELDEQGRIVVILDRTAPPTEKGRNQYNTYKKLKLTPEGYLKISK